MGDGRRLVTVMLIMGAFAVMAICTGTAQAQEEAEVNTGNVSFSAGVDFTTHYFFRGALQEDQGLITQPYGEMGATLFESDGIIKELDMYAGIWSSFHSEETFAMTTNDGPDSWYEADLYVGTSATLPANFSADLSYIAYTSPNDAFDTIQEIDLGLSYDDSEWWGDSGFALSPSATFAFEVDNTLLGSDEGTYLGLGVSPSFTVVDSEDYPITASVPVTVGLSLDDYYDLNNDDDTFGFASVAPGLSMPLSFMPNEFGDWTLSAGAEFFFLGDNNETLNNGDDFEAVGSIGISMTY